MNGRFAVSRIRRQREREREALVSPASLLPCLFPSNSCDESKLSQALTLLLNRFSIFVFSSIPLHSSTLLAFSLSSWPFLAVFDSWGRFPMAGLLEGTVTDFGAYDECVDIGAKEEIGISQYCTIEMRPLLPPRPRWHKLVHGMRAFHNLTALHSASATRVGSGSGVPLTHMHMHICCTHFTTFVPDFVAGRGDCHPMKESAVACQ